jgi:hypothetical protein
VPWVEAGYRAVLVDPQHPDTSINGPIERISATIIEAMPRLSQIIRTENVVMVIGFPPALTLQYQDPVGSNQNEPKTNIFRLKLRSLPSNAG